ncbi:MAG: hypothetical protein PHO28_04315 [Candidatus Pacebacteria bacterium]|nr:hypothetical protein [Candidatus Paceibacterota bacterium]
MQENEAQKTLFNVPIKKIEEEIEIYHDEVYDNKNRPFGHQFLIIPTRSKDIFNEMLTGIRKDYKADNLTINWKKLRETSNINRNLVAKDWLQLLYNATHNSPIKFLKINREIIKSKDSLGIKIGSIFIKSIHEMSDDFWLHVERSEDRTKRKYETLLKWGVKGCLHFFFNPTFTNYSKILVKRFYTDGEVFGKVKLSKSRIFERLENEIRDYIKFDRNIDITKIMKSQDKTAEVNFEELTDIILGATCYLCGSENKTEWKDKIVAPLKKIYIKKERGKNIEKSGHYRNFSLSYCDVKSLNFNDWNIALNNKNQNNIFQLPLNF